MTCWFSSLKILSGPHLVSKLTKLQLTHRGPSSEARRECTPTRVSLGSPWKGLNPQPLHWVLPLLRQLQTCCGVEGWRVEQKNTVRKGEERELRCWTASEGGSAPLRELRLKGTIGEIHR